MISNPSASGMCLALVLDTALDNFFASPHKPDAFVRGMVVLRCEGGAARNHELSNKCSAHSQYLHVLVCYSISGGGGTHASVTPVALFTGTKSALAPGIGLDPRSFLLSWPFGSVGGLDSASPWLFFAHVLLAWWAQPREASESVRIV